jgi:signal transduction histidine kinase/ActR/RegA family two-component response regulator
MTRTLRQRAEQVLRERRQSGSLRPPVDKDRVVEDLQIHQIELEMQNEALRQSTQELELAQQRYVELYNQAPVGFASLDDAGLILIANITLARMLGREPGSLQGKALADFMDAADQIIFRSRFKAFSRRPQDKHIDVRFRRSTGPGAGASFVGRIIGRRPDEKCRSPGRSPEGDECIHVTISDVTDLDQAERQRLGMERAMYQARKLEALGHLSGGVAHTFNNLLAIMLGNAELMRLRLAGGDHSRFETYLENIQMAGERAKGVIGQMLEFSHPEQGGAGCIAPEPAVRALVDLLRNSLPSSLDIRFEAAPDVPDIHLSKERLQQLLTNLLFNAREATDSKGRVLVTLGRVREPGRECLMCHRPVPGGWVEIGVVDDGRGIPEGDLPLILDPFFTTKEVGSGTGLGLSVVRGIMESCGGHILADSTVGVGTRFHLLFPPATERESAGIAVEPRAPAPTTVGELRMLVVDDEPALVDYFHELLDTWGVAVQSSTDSLEAKSLLLDEERRFDLLLTDQTMPNLLGTELVVAAKAFRPELKTILCTGYSEQVDETTSRDMGIDRYLLKPVDPEELRRVIDELARESREETGGTP